MSNEMKDWLRDKIEENKALIEKYPFLLPRNVFTGEIPKDYDYSYIIYLEIPEGWYKLFFQMCEEIRQPLIEANYLDKFRFLQVKEKYNTLRCYHTGAPEKVDKIIHKYEQMAYYICTKCGKPASLETQGYLASFCEDCYKNLKICEKTEPIEFKDYYKFSRFFKGKTTYHKISFKRQWDKYLKNLEGNV